DFSNIESIKVQTLDAITLDEVHVEASPSPIDLQDISINAGSGSSGRDEIVVNATDAAETITIGSGNLIQGLGPAIGVIGDPNGIGGPDTLEIQGHGGDDIITQTGGVSAVELVLMGNAGNDVLRGGSGPDTLDGGAGDDRLIFTGGADTMVGGSG